ncbi:MAG TPA: putative glycoside hydrolase [Solirubrobacteraceae bacterium]|nr:putative glycoside hydrolase [Solirubrobacteraceae bacterium]
MLGIDQERAAHATGQSLRSGLRAAGLSCVAAAVLLVTAAAGATASRREPPVRATSGEDSAAAIAAVTKDGWDPPLGPRALRAIAQRYSLLITDGSAAFNSKVAYLHERDRDLVVVPYVDALAATGPQAFLSRVHPGWFLRDRAGAIVHEPGYPDNLLMDPGNPQVIAYRVAGVRRLVDRFGYNGVFLDNVFPYIEDGGSVWYSGLPIDPRTGRPFTNREWYRDTLAFLRAVRRALGRRKLLIFNGLVTGQVFSQFRREYLGYLSVSSGAMEEGFMRWDGDPANSFRSESLWLADVESIAAVNRLHKLAIGWTDLAVPASAAQASRVELYSLSSYLLAAGGPRYYSFLREPVRGAVQPFQRDWSLRLGAPIGPYFRQGGLFERSFTHGLVLVNPTDSGRSYSEALPRSYETLAGRRVTTVTVGPKRGTILLDAPS